MVNTEANIKIEQFGSDKIVFDWLSNSVNRARLPILEFKSKDAYNTVMELAKCYKFTEDENDWVYFLGVNYYKIRLECAPSIIVP